ncbi:ATP-binding protein [Acidihalobacter prosperus]
MSVDISQTERPPSIPGKINLRRLYVMRNLAIVAQLGAIIVARDIYRIYLPLDSLLKIIGGLVVINALTWLRLRSRQDCGEKEFIFQLLLDIGALTGVLYFTGGATNPFVGLYLLPLVIASTVLRAYYTWLLTAVTVLAYSWLMTHFIPMPPSLGNLTAGFDPMVTGMWLRFVINAVLIAYFVVGMADTLRQREYTLARAREQTLRNERLVALGMLSAGAAHELGTPLATLATLTGELRRQYNGPEYKELQESLGLMRGQIDRCKEALTEISASAGNEQAQAGSAIPVHSYLLETLDQWLNMRPGVNVIKHLNGSEKTPCILTERTLSQAIISMLNNAADASPQSIELNAKWDDKHLTLNICDRGEGLTPHASKSVGQSPFSTKEQGLGLGLYLAHAAIMRIGGQISLLDRPGGGTCARVELPLNQLSTT